VADVTLTYEEIPKSINVSPHNATMDYLRKKYTNAIPFYKEPKNDEMIFDKSCPAYMTMDKSIRDELLNDNGDFHSNDQKRYMIYDIDNDGNSELFMKWVAFVQVRGGSALFDNKYAVFKSKDGIWRLYDTNASTEDNNAKFDDFYNSDNSTAYNIYFLSYAGKVYTIIGGDDSYADGGIYSEKIGSPTGEATVYLNEKGHITKIGTINFTFKTIKHITNQPVFVISTPEYDWEINDLMENYEHLLIYAINNNHFSVLENLLVKDSNLYNSQKSLIKSLYGRKIKEKLVSYNIADIKTTDKKDELKIYVTEQIGIDYGNGKGFVTKTYNWIYTAKMSNYSFRLSDLEKWK
ncbi:MAG: hypothetical protein Q8903_14600, partial [Bacteroidota bacterium]|nr:hypothetical protein [Bacteroidota bacterium]